MEERQKAQLDRLEASGYLRVLRQMIMRTSAPFWWHGMGDDGRYRVFHNGTVCAFQAGPKVIGVTADHVYRGYLRDRDRYTAFSAQFGGATIEPERWLIDRNEELDLATFEVPRVVLGLANLHPLGPVHWPPEIIQERQAVMLGGYPGSLREEKTATVENPFETLAAAVTSVSSGNIAVQMDLTQVHWPFHPGEQINAALGGMSGGGVFRVIEGGLIDRVEIVGFIYEFSTEYGLVFARHAHFIAEDLKRLAERDLCYLAK